MAKSLIITEKPSVARDIVAALGGFRAVDGQAYWESDQYVCTYAVGHLLCLLEPEDIDPAYKRWSLATLPIIPKQFCWKAMSGQEKRLKIIGQLMRRSDVRSLINACDAAREGELIFRELVAFHDCRKWVRRLWLQSMTPEAIRAGFSALKDATDLDGLGDAALCRAQSDWLIGMNATRAFSQRLRSGRESVPWSVGRVQTPTLALLVERELEILGHQPQPYFKVVANFSASSHRYEGVWFDPNFKKDERYPERRDDRIDQKQRAEGIIAKVSGQQGLASETREESLRHAPYLFNLTSLQKYMSSRYKWSSKRTLEAAQRCYEQHKVLTYPRTSSSALPSDYRGEVHRLIQVLSSEPAYAEAAQFLNINPWRNEKRTFDDKAVSDHFAIIPTGKLKALSGDDAKLFDAVVRRFLANFYPPAVYDKVRRISIVAGESFRTGPVETLMVPGWLAVYGKQGEDADAKPTKTLPPLAPGRDASQQTAITNLQAEIKSEMTKPPSRITEAGLLSLMESAGRRVENEELASALMSAEGLGTAATRADIIQNLKAKQYADDELRPTAKGIHLISILRRINVERLTSPELTARLEFELAEVEAGKRPRERFMEAIERYVIEVVAAAKGFDLEAVYPDIDPLGVCPRCQSPVFERALFHACASMNGRNAGCGFRVWKEIHGRYMERNSVSALLQDGTTIELDGFKSKSGKSYRGRLVLEGGSVCLVSEASSQPQVVSDSDTSAKVTSRRTGAERAGAASSQATGPSAAIGICPIHRDLGCKVIETRNAYVCEQRLKDFAAGDKAPVGVMLPKKICNRPLTQPIIARLLAGETTPMIDGFVSKAGKRFSAKLKLSPAGGIEFEFKPRPRRSSSANEVHHE